MAKKEKKRKFYLSDFNPENIFEIACSSGLEFTVKQSNYTYEIATDKKRPNGSPIIGAQFLQHKLSKNALFAGSVLKKQVRENGKLPDYYNRDAVKYNSFINLDALKKIKQKEIYCIDIKAAYLQVLFNFGFIKKDLYDKLISWKDAQGKKDRLAAVGALAAAKKIYHYNSEGIEVFHDTEENKLADYFYFCVYEINIHMERIKNILGKENFIFYWVDGIYFKNPSKVKEIEKYLTENNFKYTFEKMLNFKVNEKERNRNISYWQEKEDICIKKTFSIPRDLSQQKKLIELLRLHRQEYSIQGLNKLKNE